MVGEMRDLETIRFAIEAASTGHLVFATLHTRSAATISRMVDLFPASQQSLIRATPGRLAPRPSWRRCC